jgi:nuclear pore complex protein Nup205
VHYFPVLGAYISRFGGVDIDGVSNITEARELNEKIFLHVDQSTWTLNYVHAAFRVWWLSEYSGWYGEYHDGSIPENQLEEGMFVAMTATHSLRY